MTAFHAPRFIIRKHAHTQIVSGGGGAILHVPKFGWFWSAALHGMGLQQRHRAVDVVEAGGVVQCRALGLQMPESPDPRLRIHISRRTGAVYLIHVSSKQRELGLDARKAPDQSGSSQPVAAPQPRQVLAHPD